MPETMVLTRDQIFEVVRDVLEEALGADAEDITPEPSSARSSCCNGPVRSAGMGSASSWPRCWRWTLAPTRRRRCA
jgi:hypothetical protein